MPQVPSATGNASAHVEARWREIEARWGLFDSGEAAHRAGCTAANLRTYSAGLRKQGRLLGIERAGRMLHPGFQFDEQGRPLPVIADLIATFRAADRGDDAVVFWLTNEAHWESTGADSTLAPVDLLQSDPGAVRAAAAEHVASHLW